MKDLKSIFNRTGWVSFDRGEFFEVLPLDDLDEHYSGDECWCNPRVEHIEGGIPDVMIVHMAKDGRE